MLSGQLQCILRAKSHGMLPWCVHDKVSKLLGRQVVCEAAFIVTGGCSSRVLIASTQTKLRFEMLLSRCRHHWFPFQQA